MPEVSLVAGQCLLWVRSGHSRRFAQCLLYPQKRTFVSPTTMSALCQKRTLAFHSMISSARADSVGGTSMWSALAVLKLMTNSNLVDCITGKSEVFSPL